MKTISVVIPTFERTHLLAKSLRSALSQTYSPFEVIVVDDGSVSGENEELIRKIGDRRLQYVKHQTRRGGNAARNTGIQLSKGELIAFLDDDDRWMPTKLEKQIAVFRRDPRIGAVYCDMGVIDLATERMSEMPKRVLPQGAIFCQLLVRDVTMGTPTYVVRRECFEKVGCFDESLGARQDWDMWIRISEHYLIGCVPEVLVLAGEHSAVRVRSNAQRSLEANQSIFHKYSEKRRQFGVMLVLQAKSMLHYNEGNIYRFGTRNISKSLLSYAKGIATWPSYGCNYSGLLKALLPMGIRQTLSRLTSRYFRCTK